MPPPGTDPTHERLTDDIVALLRERRSVREAMAREDSPALEARDAALAAELETLVGTPAWEDAIYDFAGLPTDRATAAAGLRQWAELPRSEGGLELDEGAHWAPTVAAITTAADQGHTWSYDKWLRETGATDIHGIRVVLGAPPNARQAELDAATEELRAIAARPVAEGGLGIAQATDPRWRPRRADLRDAHRVGHPWGYGNWLRAVGGNRMSDIHAALGYPVQHAAPIVTSEDQWWRQVAANPVCAYGFILESNGFTLDAAIIAEARVMLTDAVEQIRTAAQRYTPDTDALMQLQQQLIGNYLGRAIGRLRNQHEVISKSVTIDDYAGRSRATQEALAHVDWMLADGDAHLSMLRTILGVANVRARNAAKNVDVIVDGTNLSDLARQHGYNLQRGNNGWDLCDPTAAQHPIKTPSKTQLVNGAFGHFTVTKYETLSDFPHSGWETRNPSEQQDLALSLISDMVQAAHAVVDALEAARTPTVAATADPPAHSR